VGRASAMFGGKMAATHERIEVEMPHAFADTLQTFKTASGRTGRFYSLPVLARQFPKIDRLPVAMRIVLESVLRNCDGNKITP
jgi:aconitate hydratase